MAEKIKVKESQKKFLTFPDLCANMTIEGQRKSKSKQNVIFIFDVFEYQILCFELRQS